MCRSRSSPKSFGAPGIRLDFRVKGLMEKKGVGNHQTPKPWNFFKMRFYNPGVLHHRFFAIFCGLRLDCSCAQSTPKTAPKNRFAISKHPHLTTNFHLGTFENCWDSIHAIIWNLQKNMVQTLHNDFGKKWLDYSSTAQYNETNHTSTTVDGRTASLFFYSGPSLRNLQKHPHPRGHQSDWGHNWSDDVFESSLNAPECRDVIQQGSFVERISNCCGSASNRISWIWHEFVILHLHMAHIYPWNEAYGICKCKNM